MRETGRISEIHGETVTVSCGELADCFGCMNQECKSNKKIIAAENRRHLDLFPGQFVEIEISTAGAFIQFLQSMLPPLGGFAAAYLIMMLFFPASGDGIRAAVGVIGLFLAGFAAVIYRKKLFAKNNPWVVKVLDETKRKT